MSPGHLPRDTSTRPSQGLAGSAGIHGCTTAMPWVVLSIGHASSSCWEHFSTGWFTPKIRVPPNLPGAGKDCGVANRPGAQGQSDTWPRGSYGQSATVGIHLQTPRC